MTLRWSADGRSIFTYQNADRKTMLISRVAVATGKRQVVKEWLPADRAGVTGYSRPEFQQTRRRLCIAISGVVGDLYLVEGLR